MKRSTLVGVILISSFILLTISIIFFKAYGMIVLIPYLDIILLSWILANGKWERYLKKEESRMWRRSIIFFIYTILFILSTIISAYLLMNRPPTLFEEPSNYLTILSIYNLSFVLFGNLVFILFFIWKKAPKQILSLPLVSIFICIFPTLIDEIRFLFGITTLLGAYKFYAVLSLSQIVWLLYVRFVFLRVKKQK